MRVYQYISLCDRTGHELLTLTTLTPRTVIHPHPPSGATIGRPFPFVIVSEIEERAQICQRRSISYVIIYDRQWKLSKVRRGRYLKSKLCKRQFIFLCIKQSIFFRHSFCLLDLWSPVGISLSSLSIHF